MSSRLRLHFNEHTGGCSPRVVAALQRLTAADVATYPDYETITAKVGAWLGVTSNRVVLTNGLDEGLYAVAQDGACDAGAEFIQTEPTFEMFEEFTRVVGARLVRVGPAPDFVFPIDAVRKAITASTRVIYLVDPNNPTGQLLPGDAAEVLAALAPQAVVFVDEAYADFSGRTLIGPALDRHANLVVGRTFAKGHGLAGLRIGALVAQPSTIARLRRAIPPFNVNVAAITALDAALDDDEYLRSYVAEAARSRRAIEAFCDQRGLTYWPSAGNFVLVRVGLTAADVTRELAARGIDVRDKSAAPGCGGCLRLTAGLETHTRQLLSAMEDILAARTN